MACVLPKGAKQADDPVKALMKEALRLLREIDPFPARKDSRYNVRMPGQNTPYYHFSLGKIRVLDRPGLSPSQFNVKYPELFKALKALMKAFDPEFKYQCIQINKNQQMPFHKDKNNAAKSYIIGLGSYTGGSLVIKDDEGKERKFSIRNKFLAFDGHKCWHRADAYKGERYTLVFFPVNRK